MPIDRGVLEQQLLAIGEGSHWWDRRELRDLPAILRTGETVLAIAIGKVARVRWLHRSWLIVVTDARLICLRSAGRGWRQMEAEGELITRVKMRIGPFRGRIRVRTAGVRYQLLVKRRDSYKILNALQMIASNAQQQAVGAGTSKMIRRVVDHVMALPVAVTQPVPAPLAVPQLKAPEPDREREHELEQQIDDLQEQVRFLEQLVHERQAGIPSSGIENR